MDVYISMQLMERRRPTFQINGWMPTYCQQSWWRDAHLPSIKFMRGCLPIPFKLGGGMPTNSCWIDGVMRLMLKHDESILKKKPTSIHLEKANQSFRIVSAKEIYAFRIEFGRKGNQLNSQGIPLISQVFKKKTRWSSIVLERKPIDFQLGVGR